MLSPQLVSCRREVVLHLVPDSCRDAGRLRPLRARGIQLPLVETLCSRRCKGGLLGKLVQPRPRLLYFIAAGSLTHHILVVLWLLPSDLPSRGWLLGVHADHIVGLLLQWSLLVHDAGLTRHCPQV